MKWRSAWPIFHSPLILPYILKTIWCMNITLWDYESEWPDVWPQNKCRSLWPIFHGPVILPYIVKTVWCMNILLRNYESVWPDVWPKNKCRSRVFHLREHSENWCAKFCIGTANQNHWTVETGYRTMIGQLQGSLRRCTHSWNGPCATLLISKQLVSY